MTGRIIEGAFLSGILIYKLYTKDVSSLAIWLGEYDVWSFIFWVGILLIPVLAIPNSIKVAAARDKQQKEDIKRLKNRLRSKVIATKNVKLKPKVQSSQISDDPAYAYVEVTNNETYDLRNCYANLDIIKIKYLNQERWVDKTDKLIENTNALIFPNFNTTQDEKIIRRGGKPERINVAKMHNLGNPKLIFAYGFELPIPINHLSQIYIEISLNGEKNVNGKLIPIKQLEFHGFVKWISSYITEKNIRVFGVWLKEGEIDEEKTDKKETH